MGKINQREACYNAIKGIKEFEDNTKVMLSDSERKEVIAAVTEGFLDGTVEMKDTESNKAKLADPAKMKSYVIGLVNDFMRKDKRVNGGTKYEASAPGSRPTDQKLKVLTAAYQIASSEGNSEAMDKIEEAINTRKAEIAKPKATKQIDLSLLPDDIRALLESK